MRSHDIALSRQTLNQGRRRWPGTVALVGMIVALTVAPLTSAGASARRANATPAFCQRLSLVKIDSIVGAKVTLAESSLKTTVTACIFSGVAGNMSIETQVKMPSSSTRSLRLAEAWTKSEFPAGLKVSFSAVTTLGPVAFTWHAVIGGTPYSGLNVIKGSTGYFIELGGAVRLAEFERLERLAVAA